MANRDVAKIIDRGEPKWVLGRWQVSRPHGQCELSRLDEDIPNEYADRLTIGSSVDCHDLIRVLQEVYCYLKRREVRERQARQTDISRDIEHFDAACRGEVAE